MNKFSEANGYYLQKDYDRAIDTYLQSIDNNEGHDIGAFYNIGICYLRLKQYDMAISYFKYVIKCKSDVSKYYFNLGYCYALIDLDHSEDALINFRKAKHLDENDPDCDKAINLILKAHPELSYLLRENNLNIKPKDFDVYEAEFGIEDNNKLILNIKALNEHIELSKQIDKILDDKDKEEFIKSTDRLNELDKKVLVKIKNVNLDNEQPKGIEDLFEGL